LAGPTRTTSANRFPPLPTDGTQLSLCVIAIGTPAFSNGDANPANIANNRKIAFVFNGFIAPEYF